MYGTDQTPEDSERTAFRKTEKKYKLYKNASKSRRQNKSQVDTDLSEVVDFKSVLESFNQIEETPPGIFKLRSDFCHPVFCFDNHPGFYFIPGALSIEEQCHWVRESLTSFPQPPNRTNHNAIYGPINDLFIAVQNQKVLFEVGSSIADLEPKLHSDAGNLGVRKWRFSKESADIPKGDSCKSSAASVFLRKLRWSTLGLQFDWSKRNYDVSLPHNKIPDTLCQLAKEMASPAMPVGEEFQPEAAIVNYFGSGDMLGGHLDDMEADWSKPIVSISLGCKAIFLLGGKSREDPPVAMFLRVAILCLWLGKHENASTGYHVSSRKKENA